MIKDADSDSFEIVEVPVLTGNPLQLAKDKNTGYCNDDKISFDELNERVEKELAHYNKIRIQLL